MARVKYFNHHTGKWEYADANMSANSGDDKITEEFLQENYQPKGEYLESSKLSEAVDDALTQAKDQGIFDGENGEDGGYYTPSVSQPETDKLQIDFTPSRADMPAVQPVTVDLPVPDWDAAEGDPGHIKNRTHWIERVYSTVMPEETREVDEEIGAASFMADLVMGKTYRVRWNGSSHICTAYSVGDGGCLGGEGYPFVIDFFEGGIDAYPNDGSGTVTMAIDEVTEIVHKIPAKYLPDSLDSGGNVDLGVTGATVGQTVKISAVDENGVPTAWESLDFPSGGGSERMRLITDFTTTEDLTEIVISEDKDGKPFSVSKIAVRGYITGAENAGGYIGCMVNNKLFFTNLQLHAKSIRDYNWYAELNEDGTVHGLFGGGGSGIFQGAQMSLNYTSRGSFGDSFNSITLRTGTTEQIIATGSRIVVYGA